MTTDPRIGNYTSTGAPLPKAVLSIATLDTEITKFEAALGHPLTPEERTNVLAWLKASSEAARRIVSAPAGWAP
jgi:hypothetical protein